MISPFDFSLPTRVVFAPDAIDRLGSLAAELGATRVMLVTDPGIVAAGHVERGAASLREAKLDVLVYEGVHENPNTDDVDAALAAARDYRPDLIVGLGGGSSMDTAKGMNFLYTGGGRMQDYWGRGKATRPMLPMIAVPTTAGTGSEAQSFALISDAATGVKMACGDKKASFRVALLDPKLTLTQPPRVTALTGVDALSHALETYVTTGRNAVSLAFSREAWRLVSENFARVLDDPDDLDARAGMQLGACFAGLAIENSMLGATHALANPLTARYGIVHGEAIGLMLPHVIRYNGRQFGSWYDELMELCGGGNGKPRGVEALAELVAGWIAKAGIAERLSARGVEESTLPELAADAAEQWTGRFNPRPVGTSELLELYRQAY